MIDDVDTPAEAPPPQEDRPRKPPGRPPGRRTRRCVGPECLRPVLGAGIESSVSAAAAAAANKCRVCSLTSRS